MEAANKRIQEDYPHAYFSSYSYNSFSSTDETGKTTTEVSGQAKCVAKPPTGKEVEVEVCPKRETLVTLLLVFFNAGGLLQPQRI